MIKKTKFPSDRVGDPIQKNIAGDEVQQISKNPNLMELLNERKRDRAHLSLEDVYQQLGLEDEIS